MKLNSYDTAKVERSKDKVTRSNETCALKHQIYAARHPIMEIYMSDRKSKSTERMAGSAF